MTTGIQPVTSSSVFAFKRRATFSDFPPRRTQLWQGDRAYQSFGQVLSSGTMTLPGNSNHGDAHVQQEPTNYVGSSNLSSGPPGLSDRATPHHKTPRRAYSTPVPSNSLQLQSGMGQSNHDVDPNVIPPMAIANQGFISEISNIGMSVSAASSAQSEDADDDWESMYV